MKSIFKFILVFTLCLCLTACQSNANGVNEEKMPVEYGRLAEEAKNEFLYIFKDFENLSITETVTMGRTDEAETLLIEFKYTSDNGDGVYGFIMDEDEYGNPVIIDKGADITVNTLLNSGK